MFLHLREHRKKILWEMALLKRFARHRSALLLRFGDVEKNPGPPTSTKTGGKIDSDPHEDLYPPTSF